MLAGFQDWPLVGREDELERIAAARSTAPAVVIAAPPGVGKSWLARHAVAAAEAAGAGTAWVQATRSAAAIPLGAFAGLIPPEARADDPLELMQRSAAALRERGEDVVLGVDDAQLLDPASAALVLHLVVTRAAFVVATVRTGEPCPDAVSALWKDAGAERIDLRELTEDGTAELVELVLGGAAERRIAPWVYDGSQGNPLYVRELIAGALDDGALVDVHGLWRLTRRSMPSASLTELVAGRMAELSDGERRAVGLLALGEPLRLSEISGLTDAETLARTEARGVVTVTGPASDADVRLAHPLYGDVVRASMPVTLAGRTRRELAGVVGARADRTREDALRIARWLLDAGDPVPADLLVDAAHAANASGDPELGARLASLALDTGAGIEAALLASRALALRDRHAQAEELLSGWEGRIDEPGLAAGYLEQRTSVLIWGLGRIPDAIALVERADGWWPDERWRRRVEALRLQLVSVEAGFTGMADVTEDVAAAPGADPAARRRVELVHAANLFYGGRVREAHALVQAHLPPVPLRDELDEIAMVMACVVGLESGLGVSDTTAWMAQALTAAARCDDHAAAGIAASALGGFAFLAGRNREASRWFEESVAHSERHDPFHAATSSLAVLAGARYRLGDAEGAAEAMRRCRESIGDREQTDLDRAYVVRGEAWEALAEGDGQRARELLLGAAERLSGSIPVYAGQLYHDALRAGVPARRVAGPLAALREACDAPLLSSYAKRAAAGAAADAVAMRACAGELADMGMLRYAAECAAEAATLFADAGRQDSARRAATHCRELHEKGQDGEPPEIRGLEAGEVTLTAREAQLVEMASRGLANAEIADRLVLSTRTVESHLYRAMQKLGVSDRRQLGRGSRR